VDQAAKRLESTSDTVSSTNTKTPEQFIAETQTVNVSNTISASNIKFVIPTNLWYIRDSFNALSFGFNYNNAFSRSPTVAQTRNWIWNATANYSVNLSNDLYFKPANIPVIGWFVSLFDDYKDVKVYYTPQNFSGNISARRNRNSSITRVTGNIPSKENVSRDFTAARGFSFGWKVTDGGLLNLSTSYNVAINSSLAYLLTTGTGNNEVERSESQIWNDILSGEGFGKDVSYQQSVDFRLQPRLPSLWNINRYFTLSGGYRVGYTWRNDLRQEELGRSAGYSASGTVGLVLRWKSLTEPIFKSSENEEGGNNTRNNINRNRDIENIKNNDSTSTGVDSLGLLIDNKPSSLSRAFSFFKLVLKAVFFDWENFTFNFSNNNTVSKTGLESNGTGFGNFWGFSYNRNGGPTRGFMFGLSQDVGPRALSDSTNLSDAFSEKNSFDFRTSRPLWEGAKIDVTWKVSWGLNRNTTITADEFGNMVIANQTSTGSLSRSFLSLPLPLFDVGIKKVNALYDPNAADPKKSLSDAFIKGFETANWFGSVGFLSTITKYLPRANWHFSWDGLEKFPIFSAIAERVTLDHSYASDYTEGWKLTKGGKKEIQSQKISYGFSPLVGLNMTFGQLWGGNLSGNIKYSTRSSYDLGVTTTNITETFSKDIGFSASYSKSGFELPLFGIALKNDIEFTLSYTLTQNSVVRFEMDNFSEKGTPQNGTTRTSIEPRVRYTISSKVTLSLFYKRSTVEPEGAARISPTTTNEAGLDVNIVIQ
jgi:cell surface protein SprA